MTHNNNIKIMFVKTKDAISQQLHKKTCDCLEQPSFVLFFCPVRATMLLTERYVLFTNGRRISHEAQEPGTYGTDQTVF